MPGDVATAEQVTTARTSRVMGADADLRVVVAAGLDTEDTTRWLLDVAGHLLDDLEARWSRFSVHSELARLNATPARARTVTVSPTTAALVHLALDAHTWTAGLFDPTILATLEAIGYDQSFTEFDGSPRGELGSTARAPGCAGIEADPGSGTVTVPADVRLDLGGIGKGRAADLVATTLVDMGATGALVSLGGDIRMAGRAPGAGAWEVEIEDHRAADPTAAPPLATLALADGAVATSTSTIRRWATPQGAAHHLIDPRKGRPADSGVLAATVVASEAAWAEVLAKAALLAGADDGIELLEGSGVAGLLVLEGGAVACVGDIGRFEA